MQFDSTEARQTRWFAESKADEVKEPKGTGLFGQKVY